MSIQEEPFIQVDGQTTVPPLALLPQPDLAKAQPPGRCRRWFVITLIMVLLFIGSITWFLASLLPGGFIVTTSNQKTATFTVEAHPQLVVQNDVGKTHIAGSSSGNEVAITESEWNPVGINQDDIRVSSMQSANGNTITVNVARLRGANDSIATGVNLDITVPHNTELSLVATRGSIDVTGVIGRMTLKSNTGSIQVTESILNGNSILATQTGSLSFNGTLLATDANGPGTYQFLTILGPIHITLPGNTAFDLEASNRYGVIESNVPGMTKRLGPTQFEARGSLGNLPRAHVLVKSSMGPIQVNVVLTSLSEV
jgi:hypothetical protein